jgi:hypothetical protein
MLSAQEDTGVFKPSAMCKADNLGPNGQARERTLQRAIEKILDKFEAQDVNCLPNNLENIMKQRLNSSEDITIHCYGRRERQRRIYNRRTCRFETRVVREGGSNHKYTVIFIAPTTLDMGVDETALTLFHELIHNSENYYSYTHGGGDDVSNDDYTYTCTKQCFPEAEECPGPPVSACKECNRYRPPRT